MNQTPASNSAPAKKGTNVGLIIVIIVLVLIVIGGLGGFLVYRYFKAQIKETTVTTTGTTNETTTSTSTGTSSSTNVYDTAKDNTPTDAFTISINNDIKPVLTQLFTAAKLNTYAATNADYTTMNYAIKKAVTIADAAALESAFTAKGWTKTQNVTTSDGVMLYFTKGNVTLIMQYQLSLPNEIIFSAESTATE